jgi:hypothetical protein
MNNLQQDNDLQQFLGKEIARLSSLYEDIKKASDLIGNFTIIADMSVIDEFKIAFHNIFEASQLTNKNEMTDKVNEAERHFSKAGYLTYRLYATSTILKINKILDKYDIDFRYLILPDYSKYTATFDNIQKHIAEISVNQISPYSFEKYAEQIFILSGIDETITKREKDLYKVQNIRIKDIKKQNRKYMVSISIGILGILLALLGLLK